MSLIPTTDAQQAAGYTVRYNSQGYPWVLPTPVEETFKSVAAARAYAVEQFGAKAGEFSSR